MRAPRLKARLAVMAGLERDAMINFIVSLVLLLPVSLVVAGGVLGVIGVAYAVAYLTIMLLPTAVWILSAFDAMRVVIGREAVFIPGIRRGQAHQRRPSDRAARLFELAMEGHPLSTVIRELWILAMRLNREGFERAIYCDEDGEHVGDVESSPQPSKGWTTTGIEGIPRKRLELVDCAT
jgi:hypothetical protein